MPPRRRINRNDVHENPIAGRLNDSDYSRLKSYQDDKRLKYTSEVVVIAVKELLDRWEDENE